MLDMSPRSSDGRTYVGTPNQLRYEDQKLLCSLACMCMRVPDISKSGQQLKQNCMARNLETANAMQPSQAYYKPEVSYDMTQTPPAPILESNPPAGRAPQKHRSWLGWMKKYWDDPAMGRPPYKPKTGQIRRPDIIIVNDPLKSPTQDNIYQVVEVKFPKDTFGKGQQKAYKQIAGDERRYVPFEIQEACNCNSREREYKPDPVPATQTVEEQERLRVENASATWGTGARSRGYGDGYDDATDSSMSDGLLVTLIGLLVIGSALPSN